MSPLCDRDNHNKAGSQLGFLKFVCMPFYEAVEDLLRPKHRTFENLRANLQEWERQDAAIKEAKEKNGGKEAE